MKETMACCKHFACHVARNLAKGTSVVRFPWPSKICHRTIATHKGGGTDSSGIEILCKNYTDYLQTIRASRSPLGVFQRQSFFFKSNSNSEAMTLKRCAKSPWEVIREFSQQKKNQLIQSQWTRVTFESQRNLYEYKKSWYNVVLSDNAPEPRWKNALHI